MLQSTLDEDLEDVSHERRKRPGGAGLLVVFSGGRVVTVPLSPRAGRIVVGRTAETTGTELPDERLSRLHCEVTYAAGEWTIRDLGSRNGTFVDGARVDEVTRAPSPRVIRAAETLLLPAHDLAAARMAATVNGYVVGTLLRTTLEAVEQAARTAHTLVIQGESGTGKEVAARAFHSRGPHAAGPFVALNCAAIPHGLAERLLFGAKRGAYSGAEADAPGYLQAAHRGVLFLDEVGDLDLQVQAKLLRVLETREVVPLGASTGQPVEVRVCVATHHDLRAAVAAGRFRSDLYYRLAPPVVTLPPSAIASTRSPVTSRPSSGRSPPASCRKRAS